MHDHEGVTVTGTASIDVEPDIVVAELGVDVREPDVSTALLHAEESLERVRQALVERGVERADMRTAQTSIWREERTDERGEPLTAVVHVVLGLRVVLRDVGGAGEDVHAALAAAGDVAQMNSLAFAVSDASTALAQARDAAFDDAAAVAARYATRAGRTLGPVVAVVEGSGDQPPRPRVLKAAAMDMSRSSVPVEPGQQQIGASVTVTWRLADG